MSRHKDSESVQDLLGPAVDAALERGEEEWASFLRQMSELQDAPTKAFVVCRIDFTYNDEVSSAQNGVHPMKVYLDRGVANKAARKANLEELCGCNLHDYDDCQNFDEENEEQAKARINALLPEDLKVLWEEISTSDAPLLNLPDGLDLATMGQIRTILDDLGIEYPTFYEVHAVTFGDSSS